MITTTNFLNRLSNLNFFIKKSLFLIVCLLLISSIEAKSEEDSTCDEEEVAFIDPIAVCIDFATFLDFSGTKAISPFNVNGGSFDPDGNIIDFSVSPDFFTCDDLGVNVVVLTVEDNDGNTATCTANVTISFPTQSFACFSQVNVSLGLDGTVTLTNDMILANQFFDPCGLSSITPNFFTCDDIGQQSVVFEDGLGNSCFLTVIVEDKTPLDINYPEDVTIQCGSNTDPEFTGEPVIIDNCGLFGTSYEDQIFNLPGGNIKILRTWTIIDWITGDTEEYIQVIQTTDTTSPVAICNAFINVSLDQFGNATLTPEIVDAGSYDECSDVTLSLNQSTFDCSNIGDSFVVILTVTDESGNTNQCWSEIIIEDKLAPVAVCIAQLNLSLDANGIGVLDPLAVDGGSYDNCGPLSYELSQDSFDCADIGDPILVILTVTDGSGNSNQCWSEIIVEDKIAPEIIWPEDITIECSASTDPEVLGEPVIIDNCDIYGVSYDDQIFDLLAGNFKILRTWSVIDWNTGIIEEYVQIIETLDFTPPDIACISNLNASLGFDGTVTLQPEDILENSSDNCSAVTFDIFPSVFTCADIGEQIVWITAYDESQNQSQCFTTVNIEDKLGPTAVCIAEIYLSLDANGIGILEAEDVDAGSFDNCGPLTFELSQDTFDCSNIGEPILVTLTVTDGSGNTNNCWTEVVVEDKIGPSVQCPADITVDCSEGTDIDPEITGFPFVVDNCDLIGYSYEDQILPLGGPNFKILRTWTVVDWYSGIFVECIQVINVLDSTPPDIVCLSELNASLGFDGTLTLFPEDLLLSSTDNCSEVTLDIFPSEFDCDDLGPQVVWITAYDENQNQSQCFTTVNIQDKLGPTAVCIAQINVSLDADGNAVITPDIIDAGSSDNCGPLTFDLSEDTFDCSDIGEPILIIMTVTDGSGNTNNCFTEIIVEDKIGPEITCPADITIECSQGPSPDPALTGEPTISDNCDLLGTAYEDEILPLDGASYKILRKWEVIDWNSGLTAECFQVITAFDVTAPTAVCLASLAASLDANGNLTVFPEDFDAGSFDDCGQVSFSIDQSQFDCDNVGDNIVILTVTDENGNTNQCFSTLTISAMDADGDGFTLCDGDCDDNNNSISPGVQEVCGDNIDNNCNGEVDENCSCTSFGESTQYEWIESISANGTTNTSGDDGGYGDYTGVVVPLDVGSNSLQLTPGFSGSSYNEYWTIWIDLNQNGTYELSEEVFSDNSLGTINSSLNIPPTAFLGTTTMRISMQYDQAAGPCEIFDEGEVEDYTVTISEPPFCNSQGQSTQYEWIKKVRLKSINNNSGNNNGYADFTYLSTNLNPGQSKKIRLKPGFSGSSYSEYWRVWVDWNEDGDFDDPNELEVQAVSSGNITTEFITVPNSATSGNKVMRVSMKYGSYPDPCEIFTYGEVEDYTIFVTGNNPLVSQEEINDFTNGTLTNEIAEDFDIDKRNATGEPNVDIFPNPASSFVQMNLEGFRAGNKSLKVFNQVGQLVFSENFKTDTYRIDVAKSNLGTGVHMIVIQQEDQVFTEKIIITN